VLPFRRIIPITVLLVAGFWCADSALDAFFSPTRTFLTECFHPTVREVSFRGLISLAFLAVGFLWLYSMKFNENIRQALAGSEKRYRTLVQAAPDCIVVHRNSEIIFANQQTLDFFDVPDLEPFLGTTITTFIHPQYHETVFQRQKEVLTTGKKSSPTEIIILHRDGRESIVLVSTALIEYDGQPALLTFFRDISKEMSNRKELAASQERLLLALGAARDGVWDWDITTGEMIYSQSWASMLGYKLEALESDKSTWQTLVHPDDYQRVHSHVQAHISGKTSNYEIEVRLRHHLGHYIWVLDRGKVVERNSEGAPVRMAGTHRDITARKEAELALEIRNRLAEIFLTIEGPDVYTKVLEQVCHATGSPVAMFGTIKQDGSLRVNATLPQSMPIGSFNTTSHATKKKVLPEFFEQCLADKKPVIMNETLDLPNHHFTLSRVLVVPITNGDVVLGLIVLANKVLDFTDSDQSFMESIAGYLAPILQSYINSEMKGTQLRQAQKMEALGALAGGIAHDFNNILQAILGFSTLAQNSAEPDSVIASDLQRVMKATQRGSDLVNRILLFSRREEQIRKPNSLKTIINEAIDLLRPTIPTTIEIRSHLPEEDYLVMADPSQINQVIMNLATNSFHAMENVGGVLEINLDFIGAENTKMMVPEILTGQDTLLLTIRDTGCGIDQDTIERLFDPFFTTKEVGKGTGLGLSVVHGIITSHGGDVVITSEKGIGTVVKAFLPNQDAIDNRPEEMNHPAATVQSGGRILFVDDEEDIALIGKALLERHGYAVTALTDGPAALATLQNQPENFDMVITDLTMPHMTGLQLAQKAATISKDLPFILITGLSEHAETLWEEEPSIKGVVFKPFGEEDLCQTVNQVFAKSQNRS
jgi:PAS domain S-box-containing protein